MAVLYELRGWEGLLSLNATIFDIQSFDLAAEMSTARADKMSGGSRKASVPDKDGVTISFTAVRRANLNPHATPTNIATAQTPGASGGYAGDRDAIVKFFESGATSDDDTTAWRCDTAKVTRYANRGQAENGLQIMSISVEFSDAWAVPGEEDLT